MATSGSLGLLTERQKQQAFLKTQEEVKLTDGSLVRITEEHYDDVIDFLREHFHMDEPLHNASGTTWGPESADIYMEALRQNISLMIVSDTNGDVMAVLTNQIVRKGEQHGEKDMMDAVWKYMSDCEEKGKVFEHFNVNEAVQFVSLGTSQTHRKKGLGTKLVEASLALIGHLGVGEVCVKGEGSSIFSQRIFEKVGMKCLFEANFMEYKIDGKRVFKGTDEHASMKMYGMMVR